MSTKIFLYLDSGCGKYTTTPFRGSQPIKCLQIVAQVTKNYWCINKKSCPQFTYLITSNI